MSIVFIPSTIDKLSFVPGAAVPALPADVQTERAAGNGAFPLPAALICQGIRRVRGLHHALGLHGLSHLEEAGDIGSCHIIAGHAVFLGRLINVLEDTRHDDLQTFIDLLKRP